ASRRAWRLIQDRTCKVFYPFYESLMENQAVELIGRKQQAAALLYGENTGTGLSALNGDDGGNLLAALAAEIGNDNSVTDLRALFARHATENEPTESAWFAEEASSDLAPVDVVAATETVLETRFADPSVDPIMAMVTNEMGGVITDITMTSAQSEPVLVP